MSIFQHSVFRIFVLMFPVLILLNHGWAASECPALEGAYACTSNAKYQSLPMMQLQGEITIQQKTAGKNTQYTVKRAKGQTFILSPDFQSRAIPGDQFISIEKNTTSCKGNEIFQEYQDSQSDGSRRWELSYLSRWTVEQPSGDLLIFFNGDLTFGDQPLSWDLMYRCVRKK